MRFFLLISISLYYKCLNFVNLRHIRNLEPSSAVALLTVL